MPALYDVRNGQPNPPPIHPKAVQCTTLGKWAFWRDGEPAMWETIVPGAIAATAFGAELRKLPVFMDLEHCFDSGSPSVWTKGKARTRTQMADWLKLVSMFREAAPSCKVYLYQAPWAATFPLLWVAMRKFMAPTPEDAWVWQGTSDPNWGAPADWSKKYDDWRKSSAWEVELFEGWIDGLCPDLYSFGAYPKLHEAWCKLIVGHLKTLAPAGSIIPYISPTVNPPPTGGFASQVRTLFGLGVNAGVWTDGAIDERWRAELVGVA